mgnify:CR=1 FL=1
MNDENSDEHEETLRRSSTLTVALQEVVKRKRTERKRAAACDGQQNVGGCALQNFVPKKRQNMCSKDGTRTSSKHVHRKIAFLLAAVFFLNDRAADAKANARMRNL